MTLEEVIKKWSVKHGNALQEILKKIASQTTIIVPKRKVVPHQILKDLGYKRIKVTRYKNGQKYCEYAKPSEDHNQE